MKTILSAVLVAIPAISLADVYEGDNRQFNSNLPVVPVSAIMDAESKARIDMSTHKAKEEAKAPGKGDIVAGTEANGRGTSRYISVKPGINEIIPVALGHANRITFPFDEPKIRTTSSASFDVEENILHLSSNIADRPITAFVTDASDPQNAMSLTFVPRRIPPVDLIMQFEDDGAGRMYRSTVKAEAWELTNDYIETLRNVLREVAIGSIPDGFTLNQRPDLSSFAGCMQSGLAFDWSSSQNVEGHSLTVTVGLVQNVSSEVIEFRESSCAAIDVRAVSTHPNPILMPGATSEVYIVRTEPKPLVEPSRARPRLIGDEQ